MIEYELSVNEYELKLLLDVEYYCIPAGRNENPNYEESDYNCKYTIKEVYDNDTDLIMHKQLYRGFDRHYGKTIDELLHDDHHSYKIVELYEDYCNDKKADYEYDRLQRRYE